MGSHDAYVSALKSTLANLITKTVVARIVAAAAFMSWGPLQTILTYIISKIVELIIYETEMAIFIGYIDARVNAQGKEFTEAAIANELAQKTGTPEQKVLARERLIKATREFVVLRN